LNVMILLSFILALFEFIQFRIIKRKLWVTQDVFWYFLLEFEFQCKIYSNLYGENQKKICMTCQIGLITWVEHLFSAGLGQLVDKTTKSIEFCKKECWKSVANKSIYDLNSDLSIILYFFLPVAECTGL
jgi:hypothetical protein